MREIIESLLIIAAITGGLIWYALVLANKEGKTRHTTTPETHDPDAHLGHTGSE